MKIRSIKRFRGARGALRRELSPAQTRRSPSSDVARIGALFLTGSFAIAQVPVFAAGSALPVPCAGHSCLGSAGKPLGFDPLGTHTTLTTGPKSLTINQGTGSAIFNWQSFNISAGNTVQFIQPSSSSVALNRVFDPNITTISGNLKANGQIYLINPNGILFGSGANVNVAGLIASTSNLSDSRITSGLLSNPSITTPVFSNNPAALGPSAGDTPVAGAGAQPSIVVQSGATLYAAGKDKTGTVVSAGRVFLFAPTVENAGTIKVDGGGQVILAAGSDVYLGSSADPSLRGLLVEVTGSSAAGVKVDPTGSISVARGNITLMGLAVNQAGTLTATSALDDNGSIRLIARQANPSGSAIGIIDPQVLFPVATTGVVNIASGSKTLVELDPTDKATAPLNDPTAAALRSTIDIEGSSVNIGGRGAAGSTVIQAHGGDIKVTARQASSTLAGQVYQVGDPSLLGANNAASVVNVGSDALIDVSGLQNVAVDGARNFVYISRITSLNLANAPYQRGGFLLGQGLYVNLANTPSWINVSNLQAAVAGTQAERNSVGGTVSLRAEGSVNLAKGSVVDISGGSTAVSAAVGRTSQLLTAGGTVVDISNASADTQYVGFADGGSYTASDTREGVSQTVSWQIPKYTAVGGYTQGSDAGTLQIYAPAANLSGTLAARTTPSTLQRLSTPGQTGSLPRGGKLQIGSNNASILDREAGISRANIVLIADEQELARALAIVQGDGASGPTIALDTAKLAQEGISRLDLTSDGAIVIAPGAALNLGPGGQLTARANAISIDSAITAPGGSIALNERPKGALPDGSSDTGGQRDLLSLIPASAAARGSIAFAPGTSISVAGLWTNDVTDPAHMNTSHIALNGGTITLSSRNVDVSGASFDVSAGAWLSSAGAFKGGNGGKLSIGAVYIDPTKTNPATGGLLDTGTLNLGADFASRIFGYGVQSGGSLAIQAQSVQIGGTAPAGAGNSGLVVVDPAVAQSGFQSFAFSGYDAVDLAPGTQFNPLVRNLAYSSSLRFDPSSATLLALTTPVAPLPGKAAPVNFALASPNVLDGTVTVGKGASVNAGITGSIAISAGAGVNIDGKLLAPAGSITAALSSSVDPNNASGAQLTSRVLQLGPDATLDVSGVSLATVGTTGLNTGSVLDAGSVALDAPLGVVAVLPGSKIRADGAVDTIDVLQQGAQYAATAVASAGGTLEISANAGAYVEGSVSAHSGNASANGGNLSVSLQTAPTFFVSLADQVGTGEFLSAPTNLTIGTTLPLLTSGQGAGPPAPGQGAQGALAPSLVNSSGFANVWLQSADQISFAQSVSLRAVNSLVLSAQTLSAPGASVQLAAPYVALGPVAQLSTATNGYSYNAPPAATGGTGQLLVSANQIDLAGSLSLLGIGNAGLQSTGAVRGIGIGAPNVSSPRQGGELQFGGNLAIAAQELYPTTQSDFSFVATAAAGDTAHGRLRIASPSATAPAPLSAGGTLTFKVNDFTSSGFVAAPLGAITVDAGSITLGKGSVLSVAGSSVVPYGTIINGTTWTYNAPAAGSNLPIEPNVIASTGGTSLPVKAITLNTRSLDAQSGSTINLSGGGDVYGIGFTAGPGGTYDYSQNFPFTNSPTTRNAFFALVPTVGSGAAPYDTQTYSNLVLNSGLPASASASFHIGQTITIGAGSALPAGTYTVLPASYALLPGAFAVQAVGGYQNLNPSSSVAMADGSVIVAGRLGYAAAGTSASLWSGFRVYSDAQFKSFSQFTYYSGDAFFTAAAAAAGQTAQRVGADAGGLQIDASLIRLASTIDAAPLGAARGADIAISVPSIVVNNSPAGTTPNAPGETLSGTQPVQPQQQLVLDAGSLSALGAETLVLGTTEQRTGSALSLGVATAAQTALGLAVQSSSVRVQTPDPVLAGEIVLAGADVTVDAGGTVAAGTKATPTTRSISVNGDGALLYAGNIPLRSYTRSGASPAGTATTGNLTIGSGVGITAKSVVFDATGSQTYDPSFAPTASNLLLSAALVNFGNAPAGTAGLDLTQALLSKFSGSSNLSIVSAGGFDVYGSATIGQLTSGGSPVLDSLTLVGPGLSGFGDAATQVTINAGHLTMDNSAGALASNAGSGLGSLTVNTTASASASAANAGVADGNVLVRGTIAESGFGAVSINAIGRSLSATQTSANTGDIVFSGSPGAHAALNIVDGPAAAAPGSLVLNATRITAQSGVNAAITVPGTLTIASSGSASAAQTQELGASLKIQAQSADIAGRIDLPAGVLQITTTGTSGQDGIVLDAGSLLRVAGVSQTFVPASATAPAITADVSAGSLSLVSASGSILQNSGATLDISGVGAQGDAGTVNLSAGAGTVQLQGALLAQAGSAARGANVIVDASTLGNFSALAQSLAQGTGPAGAEAVSLRARSGGITVAAGDVVKAHNITLEADGPVGTNDGSVQIAGTLDSSGVNGGRIGVYANYQVALQAGGVVQANATTANGAGGEVVISSRISANPVSTLDAIDLQAGSSINVAGGASGAGGSVRLRAPRVNGTDVAITAAAGTVTGTRAMDGTIAVNSAAGVQNPVIIEAVQLYSQTGDVTLDPSLPSNLLATAQLDAQNFANAALTPGSGIDTTRLALDMNLRPGIQIDTPGNITVAASVPSVASLLDFAAGNGTAFSWRYGGSTLASSTPGALTLRSGGNITINASISDGFAPTAASGAAPLVLNQNVATSGESWSYRFTAGADLAAADPNRFGSTPGNLTIGTGRANNPVTVRSGTGSIALNAGGSVVLNNAAGQQSSVVYTAGVANIANLPTFVPMTTVVQTPTGLKRLTINPLLTQFGGDLTIAAGANVVGTDAPQGDYTAGTNQDGSTQAVNEWMLRGGLGTAAVPTVWWAYITQFQQGFGVLGGGNLAIAAGGDVVRVGAVVASNGYDAGNGTVQHNTGSLTVSAAGNIEQGLFYDEAGAFRVNANASVQNPRAANSGDAEVLLAQGSNNLLVQLRESSTLTTPFNPTSSIPSSLLVNLRTNQEYQTQFFTYGDNSGLDVRLASGDLKLMASTHATVLPPNLQLETFAGQVIGADLETPITMFPSASGQLRVLSSGDISNLNIVMSQADLALLAGASAPVTNANDAINPTNELNALLVPKTSATPLHGDDPTTAAIVARSGSITLDAFEIPKTTDIVAGGDIGPVASINIQNSNAGALSIVSAGHSINLSDPSAISDHIFVAGAGAAEVVAGGSINLGTDGAGIESRGNLNNNSLAPVGASLIVAAGAGRDAAGFASRPDYVGVIDNFIRFNAFGAAGNPSSALNAEVVAALAQDPLLAPLVAALKIGLADRVSVGDPNSAFSKAIGQLTPAVLAKGAIKLASSIQVVNNKVFVNSANSDTFAPAYAAFGDLFPGLNNNAGAIEQFVISNPFANAPNGTALRNDALKGLPPALVAVIELGLANPVRAAQQGSDFHLALAALDPATLEAGGRQLLANVLQVAGTSLEALRASNQLTGAGSPYAKELTALAASYAPTGVAGLNDLQMDYNEIKAEQTGLVAVFAPRGSIVVGSANPPVLDQQAAAKTAAQLGIFSVGGGDIIGMVRNDYNVFQSRVFTIAGGDIDVWSSLGNIDAGRGPRDVAVAAPPRLVTDPLTGVQFLDLGAAVTGSGIGALLTSPTQAPSNINLMAPAGYVDAGEAGIRAQTGTVILGTNLVLNAGNIQAASGVSGGAVAAAPPPPAPPSTSGSQGDRVVEEAQREAVAQQQAAAAASNQRRLRIIGEFIGFEDCSDPKSRDCVAGKDDREQKNRN